MIRLISAGIASATFVLSCLALGVAIQQHDWPAVAILPSAVLFAGRYLVCALVPMPVTPPVTADDRVATLDL